MKAAAVALGAALLAGAAWLAWRRAGPEVRAVHPATGTVPANFLRLYVDFSEPMAGDDAFEHLRMLDAAGRPIDDAFRDLELWSRNRTRLMVYIHPGRVKTGLALGDQFGPVLEQGKRYALEIAPGMKSSSGRKVARGFRRDLEVGPPDTTQPDLARWRLEARPDRLEIECDEWIDQAGLETWLAVEGVPGRWEVDGRRVTFHPERPFAPGRYLLMTDAGLEDICGNSFRRPFESPPGSAKPEEKAAVVSRPFLIAP